MLLVLVGVLGLVAAGIGGWLLLTDRPVGGALLGIAGLVIAAVSIANSGVAHVRSRARVEHEGRARLCQSHHIPIAWVDMRTGSIDSAPDNAELHIDAELRLWNSGAAAVTLFEIEAASAAGQELEATQYAPAFKETRFEPQGPRIEQHFDLRAPEGEALRAEAGARVRFRIRASDGRRWPVELTLQ